MYGYMYIYSYFEILHIMKHIMKHKNILFSILFFFSLLFSSQIKAFVEIEEYYDEDRGQTLLIKHYCGNFHLRGLEAKFMSEIINHPATQRLKTINQYGPSHFIMGHILYAGGIQDGFSRFDHILGVFLLLRRFCRPFTEQVAGFFHDHAHTVFSHTLDNALNKQCPNKPANMAYHDYVLEQFLIKRGIKNIIDRYETMFPKRYNFSFKSILPKNGCQVALNQSLPGLDADRLDYLLQGGLYSGQLTLDEIRKNILPSLRFCNIKGSYPKGFWYFINQESAEKLASFSLWLTENNSGAPWNPILYSYVTQALEIAVEDSESSGITLEDILYNSGDKKIWKKLRLHKSPIVKNLITKAYHINRSSSPCFIPVRNQAKIKRTIIPAKFRGVDPLVLTDTDEFTKLSNIDSDLAFNFRQEFYEQKKNIEVGTPVMFTDSLDPLRHRYIIQGT